MSSIVDYVKCLFSGQRDPETGSDLATFRIESRTGIILAGQQILPGCHDYRFPLAFIPEFRAAWIVRRSDLSGFYMSIVHDDGTEESLSGDHRNQIQRTHERRELTLQVARERQAIEDRRRAEEAHKRAEAAEVEQRRIKIEEESRKRRETREKELRDAEALIRGTRATEADARRVSGSGRGVSLIMPDTEPSPTARRM